MKPSPPNLYLAGPTASGKTALSLSLAEKLNGEIISVDSMNVYRGLNIGTAKPSLEERNRVRHHLIDVADISQEFDAATFCKLALEAEMDIRSRARQPIFCGGTGLYFKAYIYGIDDLPPINRARRTELESMTIEGLSLLLKNLDPQASWHLDVQNPRRLIRAIEILEGTGKTLPQTRQLWNKPASKLGNFFVLNRSREDLITRINQRVNQMFERGLVDETEELMKAGLLQNRTACQAIGYRQVIEFLQGVRSLAETIELVKIKTRQFAKRQMTWFRAQPGVRWIEVDKSATANELISTILAGIEKDLEG